MGTRSRLTALAMAACLVLVAVGAVSAHQAKSVSGTVDCSGNYTIIVRADVWGNTDLIVTLDGVTIWDQAGGGSDTSVRTFTITGTGATAGETITAKTSDSGAVTGTLEPVPALCSSPSPTPTPTPTATPTPTPSATPTATESPSQTPRATHTPKPTRTPRPTRTPATPTISLVPTPATTTTTGKSGGSDSGLLLVLALLIGGAGTVLVIRRLDRTATM